MKNICFIVPGYPTKQEPIFSFIGETVRAFADQGFHCTVIAEQSLMRVFIGKTRLRPFHWVDTSSKNQTIDIYQPRTLTFSFLKIRGRRVSEYWKKRAVVHTYQKVRPATDLLYAHFWSSAVVGGEIANIEDIPLVVVTGESIISVQEMYPNSYIIERLRHLAGIISVSSKNVEESKNLGLGIGKPFRIIPNAIDETKFNKCDRATLRNTYGFSQDDFIISFVGAFKERKGPLRVLAAIQQLQDPAIKAIFIGAGPQVPEGEEVLFAGTVPHAHISDYLNCSDVFLLPTQAEGCCNAIIEAMACGLPIISSDLPFNYDVLDTENAILVDPNDVHAIATAIHTLKNNSERRDAMGLSSLQKSKALTLDNRIQNMIEFINEVLE
ncbi:MAG: glycosyltransferase family 4 protein [Sphaerochaeta sp.]|nr:glycosyltransferase family 4 protein [Sphaerochaeta sp.]